MSGLEVIGLLATTTGIIQLVDYGLRFAKALNRFSREGGSAFIEIERFAKRVKAASLAISLAVESLYQHRKSPVMTRISATHAIEDLVELSQLLKKELWHARQKVTEMRDSRVQIFAIVKWVFNRRLILEAVQEMDSVMVTLNLVMSTINFEHCQQLLKERPTATVPPAELARLRKTM